MSVLDFFIESPRACPRASPLDLPLQDSARDLRREIHFEPERGRLDGREPRGVPAGLLAADLLRSGDGLPRIAGPVEEPRGTRHAALAHSRVVEPVDRR